jgi:hypothetical protein
MKSFDKKYLAALTIPHHLISIIRQIGEYKGKQELYKKQAPEMLRVSAGLGSKTDIVLNTIDSFIGDFGISDLEKACPTVSRDMLRHILFKLRDQDKIQPIGKWRSARWLEIV